MRRFRSIWFLAMLAVLYTTLAPQAFASWVCEGRTCGITLWYCCCVGPEAEKDGNCGGEVNAPSTSESAACPAECECVLTVTASDTPRPATPSYELGPVFPPVLLPQPVAYLGPLPTEKVARALETRGPPLPLIAHATPGRRGPPALALSLIGS